MLYVCLLILLLIVAFVVWDEFMIARSMRLKVKVLADLKCSKCGRSFGWEAALNAKNQHLNKLKGKKFISFSMPWGIKCDFCGSLYNYESSEMRLHCLCSNSFKKILILEDNFERQAAFRQVCRELDLEVEIWNSAPRMIAALSTRPKEACIFSLDHDLYDPKEELGDGMMLVDFLLQQAPFAPVLIHSSNSERSGMMRDRLLEAGWDVKRVPPLSMGETWIFTSWADKLRSLIL
ncbi:MAG: hypothetical protein RL095_3575 [Verrucomicrobiota bacterium]|jgi:CheY-like chemotaxis protein